MPKKFEDVSFDTSGPCPMCKREFKSDDCIHSFGQVMRWLEDRKFERRVREIVRDEIKRIVSG